MSKTVELGFKEDSRVGFVVGEEVLNLLPLVCNVAVRLCGEADQEHEADDVAWIKSCRR